MLAKIVFLSLVCLLFCCARGANSESLKDLIDVLYSREREVELGPDETKAKLKLVSELTPESGDTEETILKWELAKKILSLVNTDTEAFCKDKSRRDEFNHFIKHDLLKPEYIDEFYEDTDFMREKSSNLFLGLRYIQYATDSYCEKLMHRRVCEAIGSYHPDDRAMIQRFYAAIDRYQNGAKGEEAMIAKASAKFMDSQAKLDKAKKPKLSKEERIDNFNKLYEKDIVKTCRELREKIGKHADDYRTGQVYVLRVGIDIRSWLDVEEVCKKILENVDAHREMALKEATKKGSLLKLFGFN